MAAGALDLPWRVYLRRHEVQENTPPVFRSPKGEESTSGIFRIWNFFTVLVERRFFAITITVLAVSGECIHGLDVNLGAPHVLGLVDFERQQSLDQPIGEGAP